MDVEHLWFSGSIPMEARSLSGSMPNLANTPSTGDSGKESQNLTVMADKRLYKLVKWCKSLPLFKNILVSIFLDRGQICERNCG